MDFNQIIIPFFLTLLAGLSTVVGSLIFLYHAFCKKKIYWIFSWSFCRSDDLLSFVELLPYSIKELGFLTANICFFTELLLWD
jgi:zinc transporter ZupT